MSSSSAGVTARRAAAQRRRTIVARRRRRVRRALLALAAFAAALFAIQVLVPLFETAYRDLTLPLAHEDIIVQQAHEKGLDPALIAAVIYAETKFDARTSSAGAEGLMQILPATAKFLAHRSGATTFSVSDLSSPQVNIAYGSYYLRYLLDSYGGNKMLALAAYNGGQTNVDTWIARARAQGHTLTVSEIPFPQTRAYVEKVLSAQKRYRHTYPTLLGYR
ncbi:MAG TPA: lytic transglycosylase domain-containing protein [Solirubrobacteraceae bacterium]|jgi:soluble lytic murein transglycosylase|nr:lytic transglycosylase domain-containing protein [Solirubrobacteraceae bacterium]